MSVKQTELTQLISELFGELVAKKMTRDLLEELTGPEVTPPLFHAMLYVYRHPDCSIRRLSQGLAVTLPAGSQLVERLVKKGLAGRTEGERDRRLSQIKLTDRGAALVEQVRSARSLRLSSILGKMDPGRRTAFSEGLQEFISWALQDMGSARSLCLHCGTEHNPCCVVNMANLATAGESVNGT